jgi:CRP/FNR family transcriptional regulator, nitrogen fixation regulation protein
MLQAHSATTVPGRSSASEPRIADQTFAGHSSVFQGAVACIERGWNIYREGDSVNYVYKVLAGAACTYKILVDGRRQIASFYLPGDAFGFESADTQPFTAEAIATTTIVSIKRSSIMMLAENDPNAGGELTMWALTELFRAQRHLLMLSQTALARVAAFLLEMAERLKTSPELELPMGRREIADYLGLTIETVSRTLARLEQSSVIRLESSRRINLLDPDRLISLSE